MMGAWEKSQIEDNMEMLLCSSECFDVLLFISAPLRLEAEFPNFL